jgi:lysophospholipase L1-like esterase
LELPVDPAFLSTVPSHPLRNFSLCVLILLALLPAAVRATPDHWAGAIAAFAQADTAHPPAPGGIIFVGSSSIERWKTLAADFPGLPVVNHGFGGSELTDSVYYEDTLVLAARPRLVVLYAGENDLAAGQTPEHVLADFKAFRTKLRAALPQTRLLFLAIKESPSRARIREAVLQANALVAADCAADPLCRFVDVATPLLDATGQTRPALFFEDRLHLRPAGYAIWIKILTPLLQP